MRELVCSHICEPDSLWCLNFRPVHPALLQVASDYHMPMELQPMHFAALFLEE